MKILILCIMFFLPMTVCKCHQGFMSPTEECPKCPPCQECPVEEGQ